MTMPHILGKAMFHAVLNQFALCIGNGAFHGMKLLGQVNA